MKSRFAKFQNVPELLSMYRTFADVVTKNDLDEQAKQAGERPLTPPIEGENHSMTWWNAPRLRLPIWKAL